MKFENELKLQAYLDGELSARETKAVAELVTQDTTARELLAELRFTKNALAGNEPEVKLPESREFYWCKIQREIQRLEAPPATRPVPWFAWWKQKYWIPFTGFAVMVALV